MTNETMTNEEDIDDAIACIKSVPPVTPKGVTVTEILDKIRTEIMQLDYDLENVDYDYNDMTQTEEVHMICREEVLQIIDKYTSINAVTIPKGATNGDMIKAMFNPYKICKYEFNVRIYMTERDFEESDYQMNYDRRWWDAPYEGGRKNDE